MNFVRSVLFAVLAAIIAFLPADAQVQPTKIWSIQAPVLSLGHCTLTVSGTTATAFSACTTTLAGGSTITGIPPGTFYALVVAEGQIRYWDDGTAPTTTVGVLLSGTGAPWQALYETGTPLGSKSLSGWLGIGVSGNVTANIIFYGIQ
jgi:hypothetical protein